MQNETSGNSVQSTVVATEGSATPGNEGEKWMDAVRQIFAGNDSKLTSHKI